MGTDRDAVQEFLRQFAETWKTNDGGALADSFTEDGALINPFGRRADGRDDVAAMYTEFFGGMLNGTTTAITVETVRAVGPDHAFVDAEQIVSAPDGSVVLTVHLAALLRRDGDGWLFADARPFAFASAPA